jgi:serine/threonine-protein kinase
MRDLPAGTMVDDRYRIVTRLGSGGMADVYCAEDTQLGRRIALKLLHARFAEDEEFVERFRREASHAAGLQHQHVVSVYDRGEWDGTSYIAMEFVDGRTLKQLIRADAPMEPLRAIDLALQVLRAARFAHRRGVIHRDLKPHNVIVEPGPPEHAKVTDFGIARAGASDMTQTGSIMGTAQYLSPEQAQGHAVTPQSDLYSIGICLYEMLTGRLPFDGESAVTIALKQVNEAPVPPSHYNAAVPAPLEDAVLRALAKEPGERFADADAFMAALEDARAQIVAGSAPPAQDTATLLAVPEPPLPAPAIVPAAPVSEVHEVQALPPDDGGPRWPWALLLLLLLAGAIVAALFLTGAIGAQKVRVPNVVRTQSVAAAAVLHRAGLEVSIDKVASDKPRGIVIGQDPAPGTRVKEGTEVNLSVSDGPGTAQVPVVDGLTRRAARKRLSRAGFEVGERRRTSTSVAEDHVIRTQPAGGTPIEIGSRVTIFVSTGPPLVDVPQVTGRSLDEARAALDDAGLRATTTDQETLDADPGTVLAQDPASGQLPKGSSVALTVARAPSKVEVPDVTGKLEEHAIRDLQKAGLGYNETIVEVDSPDEDGRVQAQDPEGGTQVDPDERVRITVGRFNPPLDPEGSGTTTPTTATQPAPAPTGR